MIDDGRLPYFHCYPAKLLGAIAGMPPDQALVYMVVLLRIYEVRGPCPDGIEVLARRVGISKRRVADALEPLFRAEKLMRVAAGIMNPFAERVLAEGEALHQKLARAGAEGGSRPKRKTPKESVKDSKPGLSPAEAEQKQLDLDVVREPSNEGSRVPDSEVVEAPDARTLLFRNGAPLLQRITGKPDQSCRRLIVKWLRDNLDDAVAVLRAIEDAARDRVADPVAWIEAALRARDGRIERKTTGQRMRNGWAAMVYESQIEKRDGYGEELR